MKKIIKVLPFIIAIFVTVMVTHAYYSTTKTLPSIFKTDGYVFKLNAGGGTFSSSDKVVVLNGKTTLPTPTRNGYTFLGYSNSSNGNVDYSISVNDVKSIDDKEIYAKWQVNTYTISYNLNGGTISGNKTNYNVEESFTLPTPTKTGSTFLGWTGSNSSSAQATVTIPKGTTGNLSYNANWSTNSYTVDVNPVIDGTAYNSGLSGYTFDVWVDGTLVADDVIDWCQNVLYGSKVRVKANGLTGRNTSYDQTFTVGTSSVEIKPSWTTNTYEAHFYLNGTHRLTTYNKYGAYISTPNTSASALGYDGNFYYISSYTPWETWYQPDKAVGFTINIAEYHCAATFGSAGNSNATYQKNKMAAAGYVCNVNGAMIVCEGNANHVLNIYNNGWNILPRSGNGYSIYKSMWCDSGYGVEARR